MSSKEQPTIKDFKKEYADCERKLTGIAIRNMFPRFIETTES